MWKQSIKPGEAHLIDQRSKEGKKHFCYREALNKIGIILNKFSQLSKYSISHSAFIA